MRALARRYMGKDSVQISAAATLLADAAKHVTNADTMSRAENSGTAERTARHYVQRVINASNMELEATQAASIVLGMPSSTGSHSNEYHGAWDAVDLAKFVSKDDLTCDDLLELRSQRVDEAEGGAIAEQGGSMGPQPADAEEREDPAAECGSHSDASDEACSSNSDWAEEGGAEGTCDDALITRAFEPSESERTSRRTWVVAVARRAMRGAARDALAFGRADADLDNASEHAPSGGAERGGIENDCAGRDCAESDAAQESDGACSDADDESIHGDVVSCIDEDDGGAGAVGCSLEAIDTAVLNSVEQIDLEKHFGTHKGSDEGSGTRAYRTADGHPILLCKMHHYAWRDARLERINALEFTSLFVRRTWFTFG